MEDKKIKEIFAGIEGMIKTALDLEIPFNTEIIRLVCTKNKTYRFSVKLDLIKKDASNGDGEVVR